MSSATVIPEENRFRIEQSHLEGGIWSVVSNQPLPGDEAQDDFYAYLTDRAPGSVANSHDLTLDGLRTLINGANHALDIGTGKSSLYSITERPGSLISLDVLLPEQVRFPSDVHPWVQGFADYLPFKDEAFDLIIATFSLPLWGNTNQNRRFFNEVYRCLRVGGIACITASATKRETLNPESLPDNTFGNDVHIGPKYDFAYKYKKGRFTDQERQIVGLKN